MVRRVGCPAGVLTLRLIHQAISLAFYDPKHKKEPHNHVVLQP
jgi:hypothetical protein